MTISPDGKYIVYTKETAILARQLDLLWHGENFTVILGGAVNVHTLPSSIVYLNSPPVICSMTQARDDIKFGNTGNELYIHFGRLIFHLALGDISNLNQNLITL